MIRRRRHLPIEGFTPRPHTPQRCPASGATASAYRSVEDRRPVTVRTWTDPALVAGVSPARAQQRIDALARLSDLPGITPVRAGGLVDSRRGRHLYLVTDDNGEVLDPSVVDPAHLLRAAADIAAALHRFHAAGHLHLALCPQALTTTPSGQIHLSAHRAPGVHWIAEAALEHQAPEVGQVSGGEPRSDVYALASTVLAVLDESADTSWTSDAALVTALERATAPSVADRPSDLGMLADELDDAARRAAWWEGREESVFSQRIMA